MVPTSARQTVVANVAIRISALPAGNSSPARWLSRASTRPFLLYRVQSAEATDYQGVAADNARRAPAPFPRTTRRAADSCPEAHIDQVDTVVYDGDLGRAGHSPFSVRGGGSHRSAGGLKVDRPERTGPLQSQDDNPVLRAVPAAAGDDRRRRAGAG